MGIAAVALVAFVAVSHVWFLVLECFLWTHPRIVKQFAMTPEFAAESAPIMKNQGLYNGFLAAGLVWGLVTKDPAVGLSIRAFFLACVVVAGIVGALTAKKTIFFIQSVPAIAALAVDWLAHAAK